MSSKTLDHAAVIRGEALRDAEQIALAAVLRGSADFGGFDLYDIATTIEGAQALTIVCGPPPGSPARDSCHHHRRGHFGEREREVMERVVRRHIETYQSWADCDRECGGDPTGNLREVERGERVLAALGAGS